MDRVSGFDPEGCRFESYYSRCSLIVRATYEFIGYVLATTGTIARRTPTTTTTLRIEVIRTIASSTTASAAYSSAGLPLARHGDQIPTSETSGNKV